MELNKSIVIPIFVFLATILMGVGVFYTVLMLRDSSAPTAPDASDANNACVVDISIGDPEPETHLVCESNTCKEVEGVGENQCETIGSSDGCFACKDLKVDKNTGQPPLKLTFEPSATSDNETTYTIDFGDESDVFTTTDPTETIEHTYAAEGTYKAQLAVSSSDATGALIQDNNNTACAETIVVSNEPVPVCISLTADKVKGTLDDDGEFVVKFVGKGEGDDISYKYEYGDGAVVTTKDTTVNHTYDKKGTYNAELTILSNGEESAETDTCKVSIKVEEQPKKHLECVSEACVEVDGDGSNECKTSSDCVTPEQSHLVCRNEACIEVSGSGSNECKTNTDCITKQTSTPDTPEEKPVVPKTGSGSIALYTLISVALMLAGGILLVKKKVL